MRTASRSPVHGDRGLDRGVDVLESRLEGAGARGQRGEGRQVPARRTAGDDDEIGITPVLGDVLLDPSRSPA